MSLKEDALRDTRVLNTWLDDVESVILEIVVQDALSNSEVFVGVFDNGFLEVDIEFKHLKL